MKFFTVIFFVIAVTFMAKADDDSHSSHSSHCSGGLAYVLGPLLALLQPLLSGVNCGLQAGSAQIGKGVHQVGNAVQGVTQGVSSIVANAASGTGGTVKALPAALYHTTKNLQEKTGIVGDTLDTLTGAVSNSHHHCHHSTSSM